MKQETYKGKHTDAHIEQRGQRQYWWYTIVSVGVGAFAAYWANSCDHHPIATNSEYEYEVISDSLNDETDLKLNGATPYYYDTPIDKPLRYPFHHS